MKLFFMCLLTTLVLSSCEDTILRNEIDRMKNEKSVLQNEITQKKKELKLIHQETKSLVEQRNSHQMEVEGFEKKLNEVRILTSGRNPRYILKIRLKQSRISLDISKHMKDAINTIEFELPVDKEFYDSVQVGTKITKKFRTGSFILNGTWSDWTMTIKEKSIR